MPFVHIGAVQVTDLVIDPGKRAPGDVLHNGAGLPVQLPHTLGYALWPCDDRKIRKSQVGADPLVGLTLLGSGPDQLKR